jgi:hypothetical protein
MLSVTNESDAFNKTYFRGTHWIGGWVRSRARPDVTARRQGQLYLSIYLSIALEPLCALAAFSVS